MISLMFALLASPLLAPPVALTEGGQAVQASLQSCALENGRYVCRYAVPDILIVPVPGTNIVADAPATVLGSAPSVETETVPPEALIPVPVAPTTSAPAAPAAEAGPILPIDSGVLTEREAQLVTRCADAGWMSLCLPDDRRAARTLRERQDAYQAVRLEVARLLGQQKCDLAVKTALDGGYMGLARETRDYCAAPTTETTAAKVTSTAGQEDDVVRVEAEAAAD